MAGSVSRFAVRASINALWSALDTTPLSYPSIPVSYTHLDVYKRQVLRLRTHLIVRHPLLFENLRRYLFATKVAHSASGIIEKLFGVRMDNNEFAYLVLSLIDISEFICKL